MIRGFGFFPIVAALFFAGCGGSVCGNKVVEPGEDCDEGAANGTPGVACSTSCKKIALNLAEINVGWTFDLVSPAPAVPGYNGASCSNFGTNLSAHVQVSGPSPFDEILDCTLNGKLYAGVCPAIVPDGGAATCPPLASGEYQVTVTLLNPDGSAVTNPVTTPMNTVAPGPTPVKFDVVFHKSDFLNQYTGTLDFHASWGSAGGTCPDQLKESILLVADGDTQPVNGKTTTRFTCPMGTCGGTKLDGAPGMCFIGDGAARTYEQVDGLPWGLYKLSVYSADQPYCGSIPVFVNPGKFNTTYELVAAMVTPQDGGVPDGGASCP